MDEYPYYSNMLWTAPELLRSLTARTRYGTQKGDIYSLGVILQEIIYRARPFFDQAGSPKGKKNHSDFYVVSLKTIVFLNI